MELEGIVCNGVIVPDNAVLLPEGTRVRISPAAVEPTPIESAKPFGERFARFRGTVPGLPPDLAKQHDHFRLGTAKR